ncbi:MAG: glycosyltransferase, partial [Rhodoferax sp.]|nr:glycosyltransferase [Rhodoferax sp.]
HYRLRRMAQELGIAYITREINQQAKAGNINHALQYTDADLVLILDCDHVPTSDILENTVGHFVADAKLFLVQTPHFFINPAPIEKSLSGIADPSVESDMFYRKIHSSMNFWNASYFCGSAAVLRRSYLEETGGICGTTITEDAETALYLHGRGYNSKYINKPMICGLSPESYDDYVSQHTRWAQGMVQLLILNNPLTNSGLTMAQRITYFNSCFFWLFSFARFIYFIAPASYLVLGMNVYNATWMQILAFTAPHVLGLHVVMNYFYGGTRQPVFSEIYETVQSLFLIPAIISVLLNPWKPKFIVTPKGNLNDQEYLSPVSTPFFLVIAINFIALVISVMKWFTEPALRDVILVTGIWCIFNMLMVLLALGAFWEKKQVRKFYRIFADGPVHVHFPRMGCTLSGEVRDVSATGIGFELALPFVPVPEEHVTLEVRDSYGAVFHFESKIRRAIPRAASYLCGSEFVLDRVSQKEVIAYVFGDSQRWKDVWDRKSRAKGTPRMLWYLTKMGVGALIGSTWSVTLGALRTLYRLGVAWLTTPVLRDRALTVGSWCVYYFQLALASLLQVFDKQHKRKLQRNAASGKAEIYFPRVNAWVIGDISDVSLTGIGVFTNVPFAIAPRERVVILPVGKSGASFRFDCQIQRVIKRDGRMLCGAEFMVDVFTYPQIVKFVHGDSRRMMREARLSTREVSSRAGPATANLFKRVTQFFVPVLKSLHLRTAAQKKPIKELHG